MQNNKPIFLQDNELFVQGLNLLQSKWTLEFWVYKNLIGNDLLKAVVAK